MTMDLTDKHIVFLLDQNARMSLTDIAGELKLSREAVNYRINKLLKKGVIRAFLTKLDFDKLGLVNYAVYFKLSNINSEEYKKLIEELGKKGFVTWMASLGGRFDLVIEIAAERLAEFNGRFNNIMNSYAGKIGYYQVSTRIAQYTCPKDYLWPEKVEKKENLAAIHKTGYKIEHIDSLDKKIISVLATNARISVVELSEKIGEAPTTVSFRIKQLERRGIIKGYFVFSGIEIFEYTRFKALISVRNSSQGEEERLLRFCQLHPNIYYYNKTLGSWNYEIEVDVKTPQEYQQFLIGFRSRFSNLIQDIESLSLFEEHKYTFWPEAGNEQSYMQVVKK
jgi:Lrp/AsnC family leucine-responsive transcriptional regulator